MKCAWETDAEAQGHSNPASLRCTLDTPLHERCGPCLEFTDRVTAYLIAVADAIQKIEEKGLTRPEVPAKVPQDK